MRLKQFVTNSEIIDSDVSYCGVHDYRYNEGNKNGEAIYIGTSSKQVCLSDGRGGRIHRLVSVSLLAFFVFRLDYSSSCRVSLVVEGVVIYVALCTP